MCSFLTGREIGGSGEGQGADGFGAAAGGPTSLGISTCFQSSPSSTSKPISVPSRIFLDPSSTYILKRKQLQRWKGSGPHETVYSFVGQFDTGWKDLLI